ncbi:MAG: hypothetical protein LBF88_10975 [Planctomycetaceae bacterium]|nr:hypothetical protein [Planctomycetaceae bacterium]
MAVITGVTFCATAQERYYNYPVAFVKIIGNVILTSKKNTTNADDSNYRDFAECS